MKIVFLTNSFNIHQKYLADALFDIVGDDFVYIATTEQSKERLDMGFLPLDAPYLVHSVGEKKNELVERLIDEADCLIVGSAPYSLIRKKIRKKDLVLRYSERPVKKSNFLKIIPRFLKWHWQYPPFSNVFMLCASAFTATDFHKYGLFRAKTYRWGYFPENRLVENLDEFLEKKQKNSFLWVGRLVSWKHPEEAVKLAFKLKQNGVDFSLKIVGSGNLEGKIISMIKDLNLEENVHLLGSCPPDIVRGFMDESQYYLFTSDREEGWGVVLNESMNSACVVFANDSAGSTRYLIENGKDGFVYDSESSLFNAVTQVINNPVQLKIIAGNAYRTISEEWNPRIAAERLLVLIDDLLIEGKSNKFSHGPCSLDK